MATVKISASRLKTFQACSWQYWCRYHLKLPDKTNEGALSGTCCHTIFECLLKPRHKKHFDAVVKKRHISASPSILRYVRNYVRKHKLSEGREELISDMIVVGLENDFFCEGGKLLEPELSFDIESKFPKYRITGFIDQPAIYKDKCMRVKDYKSSKKKFEGDELNINVQGMMYSLAVKKQWPTLTPIIDFVFLQFPAEPIQRLQFSNEQLKGFEHMLADTQVRMENFSRHSALQNLASKQKLPGNGEGFKGTLLCGWAGRGFVKSPDQKKKNGDPSFYCPYKFPFDYWALCDEAGNVLKTAKDKGDLTAKEAKGEFVIAKKYEGCPGHKQ